MGMALRHVIYIYIYIYIWELLKSYCWVASDKTDNIIDSVPAALNKPAPYARVYEGK